LTPREKCRVVQVVNGPGRPGREDSFAASREDSIVCRNIRVLHNFSPPATAEEVRASALQYVRKVSGATKPSRVNEPAFLRAVDEVERATHELLAALVTHAPPRDRETEAAKARLRGERRASRSPGA
jgi:hypothetical protein